MISVVIPTLNAESEIMPTLESLVTPAAHGVVRQVVVSDAGSTDLTLRIADEMGCDIVRAERGRGPQLAAGAEMAKADWLLFLHADTVLADNWHLEARKFIETVMRNGDERAAAFRFRLDDFGFRPRLLETIVRLRCAVLALPYGDQGLLINRRHYDRLGGYRTLPLMEDVDMVRRIGRRSLVMLDSVARTSAERYQRNGYAARMLRNTGCLTLYYLGVPPRMISRLYG
jgi:rSAM/selenodomain-associated transferase 2